MSDLFIFRGSIFSSFGLILAPPSLVKKSAISENTALNGIRATQNSFAGALDIDSTLHEIEFSFSKDIIPLRRGVKNPTILIGSYMVKCPPFYFYNSGSDVLLGKDKNPTLKCD